MVKSSFYTTSSEDTVGIDYRSAHATGTAYELNDVVVDTGSAYLCIVKHTSGVFATDLAAAKWEVLASRGDDGDDGADGDGAMNTLTVGDGLQDTGTATDPIIAVDLEASTPGLEFSAGDLTIKLDGASLALGAGGLKASAVALTSEVTGVLPVANGGTAGATAGAARTALGLEIGTDVQAYDAQLADLAGLAVTDGNIAVGDGANWVAESGATALTSLGAQPLDAQLTDVAGLAVTNGGFIVGDGANFVLETGATALTSIGGIGAATTDTLTNKTIDANGTGNSITNIDMSADVTGTLPVANGGTGAATLTDGGLLIGKGTAAVENTGVLAADTIVIGDGTTNPTTELLVGKAREYTKTQNFNETALTSSGAAVAWDCESNQVAAHAMTENTTLSAPTNQVAGAFYSLKITQHASTGPYTVGYNAVFHSAAGTALPTMTTTASAVDVMTFRSDGTNMILVGVVQDVKTA